MKYRRYTEQEVLNKSRELIHAFLTRQIETFMDLLDENFVWIGDYNAQYTKGIPAFKELIKTESVLPPYDISQEEYSILTHEHYTWISYGRFTVAAQAEHDMLSSSKIHFTFVWKQHQNSLKLLLANATHVADAQVTRSVNSTDAAQPDSDTFFTASAIEENSPQARVFDRLHIENLTNGDLTKIRIKSLDKKVHFLFPGEIMYIKSNDKVCTICTESDTFEARTTLRDMQHPELLKLHRSYLVNKRYIKSIRRYQATLTDGTTIPIGKERYMEIQRQLTGK